MFRPIAVRTIFVGLLAAAPSTAANITVNTTADTVAADGFCSLREAIVAANDDSSSSECAAGSGTSDRILFDLSLPATITVSSDLPDITESVAIVGPGADQLAIDGDQAHRLFWFAPPSELDPWFAVSDIALVDASSVYSPSLSIFEGHLVLRDSRIAGGVTSFVGGGLYVGTGVVARIERTLVFDNTSTGVAGAGGLHLQGETTIVDSTIAFNHAPNGHGGGIWGDSATSLTLLRSTVSGNDARDAGGGIDFGTFGADVTSDLTIIDSTIADNECGDGAAVDVECGAGLRITASIGGAVDVAITNTVVATNVDLTPATVSHDILLNVDPTSTVTSGGFNLVGEASFAAAEFPAGTPNANGDFVGTVGTPLDPQITALSAGNGGPTPTHGFVVMNPHPLVDQGKCVGAAADQRGFGNETTKLRVVDIPMVANNPNGGDGCDIGAVEAGGVSIASAIFADGFESARLLFWSADTP